MTCGGQYLLSCQEQTTREKEEVLFPGIYVLPLGCVLLPGHTCLRFLLNAQQPSVVADMGRHGGAFWAVLGASLSAPTWGNAGCGPEAALALRKDPSVTFSCLLNKHW